MKRFVFAALVAAGLVAGVVGCNKPTDEDCRAAISNMEKLLGTDTIARNTDNDAEIRRCKGGSTREAVACAIKATSIADLKACQFMGKNK
jgi:hypothetical protein